MAYIDDILTSVSTISASINTNELVVGARSSVTTGIKSFMISPKEKATILANFEMQFTGAIISKIIDTVMQAKVSEAQIALINKQILTETQRVASMIIEDGLKGAQTILVEQQKLTEANTTVKIVKESDLLTSNKALVEAQVLTQGKQRLDVMAGINIKNEQALSTRQSAKFEEARRFVLIESTKQNAQIQKSKEENMTLNSLAIDDAFIVSDTHLTRVKSALDAITVSELTYTEELTVAVGQVDAGV